MGGRADLEYRRGLVLERMSLRAERDQAVSHTLTGRDCRPTVTALTREAKKTAQ